MNIDYTGLLEVIFSINRDLSFKGDCLFSDTEITKTEGVYLRIIWDNPGITQYRIAKIKNCSKNLVIKHISSLEEKGYIKKVPVDNMRKEVSLTPKGEEVLQLISSALEEIAASMFEGYTTEEIEKYLEMTFAIKEKLQKSTGRDHFKSKYNFKKYE